MWINSWYSIRCNIRFAHSTVHTILDNDDGIKEIAKCLDNITCQQSDTGSDCLWSKTTAFLSEWIVTKLWMWVSYILTALQVNKYTV